MKLRELFTARDMTEGAPWKRIMEFAVPMLIGNLAQQLYNTVDSIVVGKYVGDNALAAVGTCMPIFNLLLAVFVGVSTGAGIVISQRFGAGPRISLPGVGQHQLQAVLLIDPAGAGVVVDGHDVGPGAQLFHRHHHALAAYMVG